jgi:hypothetical protein
MHLQASQTRGVELSPSALERQERAIKLAVAGVEVQPTPLRTRRTPGPPGPDTTGIAVENGEN